MSQRWAPWWVKAIGVALWAPLAWGVWRGGDGVRVMIPPVGLLTYLVAALVVDRQWAEAGPEGVRSGLRPLPLGNGRRVLRAAIAHVYAGHVKVKKRGAVVEEIRSVGVATREGLQVDLLNGFSGQDGAVEAARRVAGVLGLAVYTSDEPDSGMHFKRTAFLWLGLFAVATVAGGAWELR